MFEDFQTRTGHRALTHFRALMITPYTIRQDEARLRRERALNHPKARRQETRR